MGRSLFVGPLAIASSCSVFAHVFCVSSHVPVIHLSSRQRRLLQTLSTSVPSNAFPEPFASGPCERTSATDHSRHCRAAAVPSIMRELLISRSLWAGFSWHCSFGAWRVMYVRDGESPSDCEMPRKRQRAEETACWIWRDEGADLSEHWEHRLCQPCFTGDKSMFRSSKSAGEGAVEESMTTMHTHSNSGSVLDVLMYDLSRFDH